MSMQVLPLLVPLPLVLVAALSLVAKGPRPKVLPRLAEGATLLVLAAAITVGIGLAVAGPSVSPLIGFAGLGLAVRTDAVSTVMLLLVAFVGWVVVRYARTYLDGEPRQGAFTCRDAQ